MNLPEIYYKDLLCIIKRISNKGSVHTLRGKYTYGMKYEDIKTFEKLGIIYNLNDKIYLTNFFLDKLGDLEIRYLDHSLIKSIINLRNFVDIPGFENTLGYTLNIKF